MLVNPPFATLLMLKMLDGIGHVDRPPLKLQFLQGVIKYAARWPNERTSFAVFLITRLLSDPHEGRLNRPLTENDLGCISIKRALTLFDDSL